MCPWPIPYEQSLVSPIRAESVNVVRIQVRLCCNLLGQSEAKTGCTLKTEYIKVTRD